MPRIAHRRRGSEFGHHPFVCELVTPPLLPLALSTSSLSHLFVLSHPLPAPTRSGRVPASCPTPGLLLCL